MLSRHLVAVLSFTVAASGCSCEQRTARRAPKLELLDVDGAERSSVDFGQVQINTRGTQKLRVRNAGTTALTLSAAAFSSPLFALANPLPVVVDIDADVELELTFLPTEADQRVTGTATFTSDDPARPSAQVSLAGTGVTAVAVLNPTGLDFGEVYLAESRKLTLTLTNAGSNALVVTDARFAGAVPATVSCDLAALKKTLAGGEVLTAEVTFAPTAPVEVAGALELVFGNDVGSAQAKLKGRGVQAQPRLCFKYDDSALESCTDQGTVFLSVAMGSACDNRLFPDDGGPSACHGLDGGPTPHSRAGTMYLRNEGNTPVAYSMQFETRLGDVCSDGGTSLDFEFANAPRVDGGGVKASWAEATVRLPANGTDPKPWETGPVAIVYRPRSHCTVDSADQARVVWTRQGDPAGTSRAPSTLILNLTGRSQLPRGVPQDINFSGTTPLQEDFRGVGNVGDAPLTLLSVALWQGQLLNLSDGGTTRGTTPGEQCTGSSTDDCAVFGFAGGAAPSALLPLTLAGTVNAAAPVSQTLGRIVFGADGGTRPQIGREYRVFAVIQTDDPYNPAVVSTLKGVAH